MTAARQVTQEQLSDTDQDLLFASFAKKFPRYLNLLSKTTLSPSTLLKHYTELEKEFDFSLSRGRYKYLNIPINAFANKILEFIAENKVKEFKTAIIETVNLECTYSKCFTWNSHPPKTYDYYVQLLTAYDTPMSYGYSLNAYGIKSAHYFAFYLHQAQQQNKTEILHAFFQVVKDEYDKLSQTEKIERMSSYLRAMIECYQPLTEIDEFKQRFIISAKSIFMEKYHFSEEKFIKHVNQAVFMYAIKFGYLELVKAYIDDPKHASWKEDEFALTEHDDHFYPYQLITGSYCSPSTPLRFAFRANQVDVIDLLIEKNYFPKKEHYIAFAIEYPSNALYEYLYHQYPPNIDSIYPFVAVYKQVSDPHEKRKVAAAIMHSVRENSADNYCTSLFVLTLGTGLNFIEFINKQKQNNSAYASFGFYSCQNFSDTLHALLSDGLTQLIFVLNQYLNELGIDFLISANYLVTANDYKTTMQTTLNYFELMLRSIKENKHKNELCACRQTAARLMLAQLIKLKLAELPAEAERDQYQITPETFSAEFADRNTQLELTSQAQQALNNLFKDEMDDINSFMALCNSYNQPSTSPQHARSPSPSSNPDPGNAAGTKRRNPG